MTNSPTQPQVQYMLACENVTQDLAQNFTFTGVLEALNAPAFPTVSPSFYVVFGLHNVLPGVYTTRLVLEHKDGTKLVDQALQDIAVPSHQNKARIVLGFRNFVWPKPGDYIVKLFVPSSSLLAAFTVELREQATPPIYYQAPKEG